MCDNKEDKISSIEDINKQIKELNKQLEEIGFVKSDIKIEFFWMDRDFANNDKEDSK